MNDRIFKAALAGLLHDVGKFAQRAGEKLEIEAIVPAQWHDAESPTALIPLASRLAAGGASTDQDPARQLQSIFGSITGLSNKNGQPLKAPAVQYLPLKKLAIEESVIFPGNKAADPKPNYQTLWQDFLSEATRLKAATERSQADLSAYLPSLLDLMQQYTWCVPSAADVSLYDHSRMTAALAACLTDLPALPAEDSTEPVALLVGGDISGVQKFIYTITSRGATPGLRGRSMYLQLLTEVITRYLLDELGVPSTNVIYAGGGHLYLIVPLSAKEQLPKLQQRISRILLHHHQGDLYLALTSAEISPAEFSGKPFRAGWDSLQKGLQTVKQRKFAELGEELAERLFAPMEDGGNEELQCVVCQREHPETKRDGSTDDENRPRKCPVCLGFETLGKELRHAQYLCLDQMEPMQEPKPKERRAEWYKILEQFGYKVRVAETLGEITSLDRQTVKRRNVLALSDTARDKLDIGAGQTIGRRLLVNVTPRLSAEEVAAYHNKIEDVAELRPGNVKPFEVMAQQSKGFNRLGVLRMDVDNLGQIFSQGLPASSFTISRMAALSFRMSLFFEGWLSELSQQIEQENPYVINHPESGDSIEITQRLYSIYSGGDDLFFVGAWDLMPALAERINNDLQAYSGHHPGVHISGGISLASAKYPLYQAAEDAAEAESAAKAPRPNLASDQQPDEMVAKNALAFLGEVIPWEKYGEVAQWQIDLVELVEHKNGPRGVLQRLRELYIVFDKQREAQAKEGVTLKVYWGPGQWRSAYSLSRLAQQYKKDEPVRDALLRVRDSLSMEKFTNIQWLGLAARWAALLTRKGE